MSRPRSDSYSKTIMTPGSKKEQRSVLSFRESYRNSSTRNVSRIKSTLVKQTEKYFTYFNCDCTPDFYNKVLGPTADEAFLKGIQTVFDACTKFISCDREPDVQFDPEPEKSVPEVVSEILESIGVPKELADEIVQTSFAVLEDEKPELHSKILQTSTPDMLSKILQTIGLEPELISQIVQTSFESVKEDKPSVISGVVQTTPPPSMVSVQMQTSDISEPPPIKEESLPAVEDLKAPSITEPPPPPPLPETNCVCCQCSIPRCETPPEKENPEENPCDEETKVCICRECYAFNKTGRNGSKCKVPKRGSVECLKAKFETPGSLRLCRCYECSAPVVYRVKRNQDCGATKARCRCNSDNQRGNTNGGHLAYAKGDTCSLTETGCRCHICDC